MRNNNNIGQRSRSRSNKKNINKKNSNIKIAFIFILLFVIVIAGINFASSFSSPNVKGQVNFNIENGSSLTQIASVLEDNEVIKSADSFKIYCKLFSDSSQFKAGQYIVERPLGLKEITDILIKGQNNANGIKVTIPEGYVITQVATLMENKKLGDKDEFLKLAKTGEFDYEFLQFEADPSIKYKLEGFMYPDTYFFEEDATSEEIIKILLDTFENRVWSKLKSAADQSDLEYNELLTLASIVEKEAVKDEERAKIAGVFLNRIKIDMSLQSCATVQYALNREKFSTTVTFEETRLESPYNTYKYPGLPPGPICNPGIKSIEAVIKPDSNKYLFFVAKGDGSHYFSLTYDEHLEAIQKYQK